MFLSRLNSPIGQIFILADDSAVTYIGFDAPGEALPSNELSIGAANDLETYFKGSMASFLFPVRQSGTNFQQEVWAELQKIPAGQAISYATLAKRMKQPQAIRAIAAANGRNSLMIAVPCHRVIGKDGALTGYAGGLWRKQWLLEHEAKFSGLGQSNLFAP